MSAAAKKQRCPIYGYLAEFDGPEDLIATARRARGAGYRVMEAYTPLPLHEVSEILGYRNHLPLLVLIGGLVGAVGGFTLQYWTSAVDYPINVGGRPLNSWPAFIVPTFEMTILCAALTAVFGMFALNGLPHPYHPVFNVPLFELASRNRFFLMILSRDPGFDMERTRAFLEEQDSLSVWEVPH
jgi:Alternative complex III, ActD subunit